MNVIGAQQLNVFICSEQQEMACIRLATWICFIQFTTILAKSHVYNLSENDTSLKYEHYVLLCTNILSQLL